MRGWPLSTLLLCGCAPNLPSSEPIEPAKVELEEPQPQPIADARPLDPEIVALLTPEALAAAAAPKLPTPDPRTPAERARDICQAHCERGFDRDRLIRLLIASSLRVEPAESESMDCHHGCPPALSDEDGLRRFINGERSIVWWYSYGAGGSIPVLVINPIPELVDFPFHGTQIEIDEHNRVLRCRHVDRDEPTESVDMTCSERK